MTFVCHRNADADEAREAARFFASCGIETLLVERGMQLGRRGMGKGSQGRLSVSPFSLSPFLPICVSRRGWR